MINFPIEDWHDALNTCVVDEYNKHKIITGEEALGWYWPEFVKQIGGRTKMGWALQDCDGEAIKLSRKFIVESCKPCIEVNLSGWQMRDEGKEFLKITTLSVANQRILCDPSHKNLWIKITVRDAPSRWPNHYFYSDGHCFYYWGLKDSKVIVNALMDGAVTDLDLIIQLREQVEKHEL